MAQQRLDQVMAGLRTVEDPELHKDLVTLNMARDIEIDGGKVSLTVVLTTPACPLKDEIDRRVRAGLEHLDWVESIEINMTAEVRQSGGNGDLTAIPGVKNLVAVASGKGGVGKSTTAVNLAIALSSQGADVGILDADVYGPNIPMMLGAKGNPSTRGGKISPVEAYGLKVMSLGFMLEEGAPVIWRGPMAHQALRQFIGDWDWGELDYLILDLPPGTGDIQLTLVQSIPLSGSVIVCTPQDLALLDAKKGLRMFQQVNTPILGIVENMSWYVCPHCGERTEIFSHGGAKTAAEALQVSFLGEIPMELEVRVGGDEGRPYMTGENDETTVGQSYFELSNNLVTEIKKNNHQTSGRGPTISIKR